jgi:hypothetical protein
MNLSKTITSIAVAASMVGVAGYVYAQQTDGKDAARAATNNPNTPRGTVGGPSGTMDSKGTMNNNNGMNNNSGAMPDRTMRDGTMRDGATGATGQSSGGMTGGVAGERVARADRN